MKIKNFPFRSGVVIAVFTMLSRVFGYLRDIFLASYFGTSYIADAFSVAFKLPNFFRTIFAEGALTSAFIPIISSKIRMNKIQEALNFSRNIISIFSLVLLFLVSIMIIFMPEVMSLLASGFKQDNLKFELTVSIGRITFPYIIFISITTIFIGIKNSYGEFALGAFIPVMLNICMIAFLLIPSTTPEEKIYILSYGVIFAGFVQILITFMYTKINGVRIFPKLPKIDDSVKLMLRKMIPVIFGSGLTQINLWVSTIIASSIPGAVSVLYYSERLNQFPLAIIGISMGTVLLPKFTELIASGNIEQAKKTQNKAIEIALFLSIPCSIAFMIFGIDIIRVLFERDSFSRSDTILVANTLEALSFGLPAFILIKIFTPRFFASLDTLTPVIISALGIILNIVLSYYLKEEFSTFGIALAISCAGWLNFLALLIVSFKKGFFDIEYGLLINLLKIIGCVLILSLVLLFFKYLLLANLAEYKKFYQLLLILAVIFVSSISYFFVGFKVRLFSIKDLKR